MVATPALEARCLGGSRRTRRRLIIILAWHGRRPDPGLVRIEPGGSYGDLRLEMSLRSRESQKPPPEFCSFSYRDVEHCAHARTRRDRATS